MLFTYILTTIVTNDRVGFLIFMRLEIYILLIYANYMTRKGCQNLGL